MEPSVFDGLTKRELAVFEAIAMNQDSGHHPAILEVLLDKHLIAREAKGRVHVIYGYFVPIRAHMAWCQWRAHREAT